METHLEEVQPAPLSIEPLRDLLEPQAWEHFQAALDQARRLLDGREVWNVNSTATGGGVAEMLRSWVGYARGAGIDMRWMTISAPPDFFAVTKRIHNFLHGSDGDGGDLDDAALSLYREVTEQNAREFVTHARSRDIIFMHDPQTAGLIPHVKQSGATVIWRSHVGADVVNDRVREAWAFLEPFVIEADACVFSRAAYMPPWSEKMPSEIVPPSIDVLAPKNRDTSPDEARAILRHVGLIVDEEARGVSPTFLHHDGTPGRVDRRCEVLSTGPPPRHDNPLVVQVSRWDDLKDPIGVMRGFAERTINGTQAHLILAGPTVHSIADDPDSARVLDHVEAAWRELPHAQRSRIHLACIPMVDVEENAAIVNALQRQATVIVQKSLREGFGLTVAEAMWKSRPVVASAVGGIKDQIEDGVSGVLLEDPYDLETFGDVVLELLLDPVRASHMGAAARDRIREHFLEDRHTIQYVKLFAKILAG